MRVVTGIDAALRDEHVIGTDPPLRPSLPDVWRRRINPFAGRALSDRALTAEQDARAGMQRLRGQSVTPGVIAGLDLMLEAGAAGGRLVDVRLQLLPGTALTQAGEDISIAAPRRISLADLPVWARADQLDAIAAVPVPGGGPAPVVETVTGGVLAGLVPPMPRRLGPPLGRVIGAPGASALPRVAVLVAEPVSVTIQGRPTDPCPPDPRDDAYDDLQRIDGCRLALSFWPAEMLARRGGPDYALPAGDAARRNRLAHRVFAVERAMLPGEMHPWEGLGVPLALVAFHDDWTLDFIDRASVVRMGGQPRPRTPLVPQSGTAILWQARVAQFVEHLAALPDLSPATLAGAFRQLPPVGFLPAEVVDLTRRRQVLFPAGFALTAAPVPLEQLDLIVRESASLVPINLDAVDAVELLVPVPDRVYEPGLLETATVDPAFSRAIARYVDDRTDWLTRRELVRRRRDLLVDAVTGRRPTWPVADTTAEEILPTPATRGPVGTTRVRRVTAAAALRTLRLLDAGSSLELTAGDTFFVWARVADATGLGGISIRLGVGTGADGSGDFTRGIYWGDPGSLPVAVGDAGIAARRQGALPVAGAWTRLEVAAAAQWTAAGGNAAGIAIDGLELAQLGGTVEWGPVGKRDALGGETVWFADDAPPGSTLRDSDLSAPTWQSVPALPGTPPEEDDFGTVAFGGTRASTALAEFRSRWTQAFLATDFRDLQETGITGFIRAVEARVRATNDAIDLGFVRARADIYRVRQYMLGADAASRLVTSPALADLAVREEGARARSLDLSAFVRAAYQTDFHRDPQQPLEPRPRAAAPAAPAAATPGPAAPPAAPASVTPSTTGGLSRSALAVSRFSAVSAPLAVRDVSMREAAVSTTFLATQPSRTIATAEPTVSAATLRGSATTSAVFTEAARSQTTVFERDNRAISVAAAAAAADRRPRAGDVQGQLPLPGAVERTASVAERLKPSPAVEAHAYALAGKATVIGSLTGLLAGDSAADRPRGVAMGDLPAAGFVLKPGTGLPPSGRTPGTLADLIAHVGDYRDIDELPDNVAKHEADYFNASVAAIDNNIAIMRLVEGRIDLYNRLVADARQVHAVLMRQIDAADARLRAIGVELEEARHDVGVARGLLAEEQARVDALNARRAEILRQHARTILFRRARRANPTRAVPSAPAASDVEEVPSVACLADHADVPEELHDYAALFRDAPVAWFPGVKAQLILIDRLEAARAMLRGTRARAALEPADKADPGQGPRLLHAVTQAVLAQRRVLDQRRAIALRLDTASVALADLSLLHGTLAESASMADLVAGEHNRPGLARRAAGELEQIAQAAACLHARFAETPALIRLRWAEMLSAFDQPAPLAQLAGLADWMTLPIDLRRAQQGMVDWLFGRIDRSIAPAENAINELVRVCLLLAAHAPVDRIVPARLVAPAPARVGTRLDLAVDVRLARIGMTALVQGPDGAAIAQAVVDDLGDGLVRARIIRVFATATTITSQARVELGARRAG